MHMWSFIQCEKVLKNIFTLEPIKKVKIYFLYNPETTTTNTLMLANWFQSRTSIFDTLTHILIAFSHFSDISLLKSSLKLFL